MDRSDLIRAWLRQEAVMWATNAADVDYWFPVYTGSLHAPFAISALTFVVVQVKCRELRGGATPSPPTLIAGDLSMEALKEGTEIPKNQIRLAPIFLWLEMGIATPSKKGAVYCRRHPEAADSRPDWREVRTTAFPRATHSVLARYNLRSLGLQTGAHAADRTSHYLKSVAESIRKDKVM